MVQSCAEKKKKLLLIDFKDHMEAETYWHLPEPPLSLALYRQALYFTWTQYYRYKLSLQIID